MCYEFRLHNGVSPHEGRVEIKLGRFDGAWRPMCGSVSSLFAHRKYNTVFPNGQGDEALVVQDAEPFFTLDNARTLCLVLGYHQVLSYYTDAAVGFGFGQGNIHILQGLVTTSKYKYQFQCDPRTAVSLRCLTSKSIKRCNSRYIVLKTPK